MGRDLKHISTHMINDQPSCHYPIAVQSSADQSRCTCIVIRTDPVYMHVHRCTIEFTVEILNRAVVRPISRAVPVQHAVASADYLMLKRINQVSRCPAHVYTALGAATVSEAKQREARYTGKVLNLRSISRQHASKVPIAEAKAFETDSDS